ncbi:hypothetical protein NM208_g14176 [Fusarium decemcellulare]|uniref:Uncharacterized protein n=1 Tax=Fusarium decemcellulare TaxID=57161 RepID=A0ACC1RJL9_9HYPO|nr:hypothetical protein NM208_g14176 [Fusarium decemcellulare]
MTVARPVRALIVTGVVLWCFFLWQIFAPSWSFKGPGERYANFERDPNLDPTGEPEGILRRTSPRYAHDAKKTERIDATLLALVRNEEVDAMVQSMRDLERTWNSKFNYPWTFFNDKPFTEEFKRKTSAATKAKCNYGRGTRNRWSQGRILG